MKSAKWSQVLLRTTKLMSDFQLLLNILPLDIIPYIEEENLIEIVMDLDRPLLLRYTDENERVESRIISQEDIDQILENTSEFDVDNRAGINGTLHSVSRITNRNYDTIGITIRVGRPYMGNIDLIRDLLEENNSILFIGRPGSRKEYPT